MRVPVKAVVVNSKGKPFEVLGVFWDDGAFFLKNPRPERYPHAGLIGGRESKALSWADKADGEMVAVGESPFTLRSLLLDPKPPKPKAKKRQAPRKSS